MALEIVAPSAGQAEWYGAAYGGISLAGSISNVHMPNLGDRRAAADFGSPPPNLRLGEFLSNHFRSSDLFLKQSPMFGAKAGYFFNDFKLPWLGLELEAFTTEPNIKSQSFNTSLFISKCRSVIIGTPCASPTSSTTNQTETIGEARLRVNTVAANAIVRYRSGRFQPYAGLGLGLFHFSVSGSVEGSQIAPGLNALAGLRWFLSENVTVFSEYKYNRATVDFGDNFYGLNGDYAITHLAVGFGFHFK
jgi:opacity protein-like surface antigen